MKGCTWFIESPPKNILDMVCFHFQSLFFFASPIFGNVPFLEWRCFFPACHMKHSGHAGLSGNASTSTKSGGFSDCQAERNGEGSLLGCWEKVAIDVLTVSDLASMRLLAEIHKFTRERVMSHLATMKKCYYFLRFLYVELKLVGLAHRSLTGHQYGTRPYYRSPRGRRSLWILFVVFLTAKPG